MTKFTEAQHGLLRAAAGADDGSIDVSEHRKTYSPLVKQGLMISLPRAEGGGRLLITDAGRAEIGLETRGSQPDHRPVATTAPVPVVAQALRGKVGVLVGMLRRVEGATVDDMMAASGWQAHSVRGAISGSVKKSLGLNVTSDKTVAGRVYRIVDGALA